jgi:hypothetical protein
MAASKQAANGQLPGLSGPDDAAPEAHSATGTELTADGRKRNIRSDAAILVSSDDNEPVENQSSWISKAFKSINPF